MSLDRSEARYPTDLFRPMTIADVAARDYEADSKRARSLAKDLRECGWEQMAAEFSRLGFVAYIAARAERAITAGRRVEPEHPAPGAGPATLPLQPVPTKGVDRLGLLVEARP